MAADSTGTLQPGCINGSGIGQSIGQIQQQQQYNNQIVNQQRLSTAFVTSQSAYLNNNQISVHTNSEKCETNDNTSGNLIGNELTPVQSNLPNGWRRVLVNGDVVYISPSGATLRNIEQIKEYLLSTGTCKCGVPCPVKPDFFFDFNSRVPTVPLQIIRDGTAIRNTPCIHHRRFLENQKRLLRLMDGKKRKLESLSSSNSSSPVPGQTAGGYIMTNTQNNLVVGTNDQRLLAPVIYDPNGQTGQLVASGQPNIIYQSDQVSMANNNLNTIGPGNIIRTPPWKRVTVLNQHQQQQLIQQQQQQQSIQQNITQIDNQRVPPLPLTHIQANQFTVQSDQQQVQLNTDDSEKRMKKVKTSFKKRPTFKDDPTGYLNQQTALLQNTILNVQTPDYDDDNQTPKDDDTVQPINYLQPKTDMMNHITNGNNMNRLNQTILQPNQQTIYQCNTNGNKILIGTNEQQQQQVRIISNQQPFVMASHQQQQQQQQHQPQFKIQSKAGDQTIFTSAGTVMNNQIIQNPQILQHQIIGNTVMTPAGMSIPNGCIQMGKTVFSAGVQPRMLTPQQIVVQQPSIQMQSNQMINPEQIQTVSNANQQQQQMIMSNSQGFVSNSNIIQTMSGQNQVLMINNPHMEMGQPKQQQRIGLQAVTTLPNGMIQINNQNCDTNQLKQQKHQNIIYQQQFQQQNQIKKIKSAKELPKIIENIDCSLIESQVTSSYVMNQSGSDEMSGDSEPAQVGAISTSHESPILQTPSPAESPESFSSQSSSSNTQMKNFDIQQKNLLLAAQTSSKNTITSVLAGKANTATTTMKANNLMHRPKQKIVTLPNGQTIIQNCIPMNPNIQMQQLTNENTNQILMTSSGQIIVMPQQQKPSNQIILNNSNNTIMMNPDGTTSLNNLHNGNTNEPMLMDNGQGQLHQEMIQNTSQILTPNGGTNQNNNFIMTPANNLQQVLFNGTNLVQSNAQTINSSVTNNRNLMQQQQQQQQANTGIITTANNPKVITNAGNLLQTQGTVINSNNHQMIVNNSNGMISPNNGGFMGQQVVLNTLSNGYMIQPHTVDNQQQQQQQQHHAMNQLINQEMSGQFRSNNKIIMTSNLIKRKAKKRKSDSPSSSKSSTPESLSPQQSPQMQQQTLVTGTTQPGTILQLAPQFPAQGFQLNSPMQGMQGITLVQNKNMPTNAQQIILPNGQTLIQPLNLIGQQLIMPAGLMMAPDTTLLQIQNMAQCNGILASPQGMMIGSSNQQQKNFLSPNSGGGQQFIMNQNGQLSPIAQVYSTPMGLMTNSAAGFLQQQNTLLQQSQNSLINTVNNGSLIEQQNQSADGSQLNQQHLGATSPPDTTTHSPIPERPSSEKSGGSDNMVPCVSSSEQDIICSSPDRDGIQYTTQIDGDGGISYQLNGNKPSDSKIMRLDNDHQQQYTMVSYANMNKICTSDSPVLATSSTASITTTTSGSIKPITISMTSSSNSPTYSIGELVWGKARGHPAWPGKVISPPPDGVTTSTDSLWVRWFGGRPNIELVAIDKLKSLSDGLEAHHKAQKDTRKSRKLNSQLENAIQEAMTELDRMASSSISSVSSNSPTSSISPSMQGRSKSRANHMKTNAVQLRSKPVKIAPAPAPAPPSNMGQNNKILKNIK